MAFSFGACGLNVQPQNPTNGVTVNTPNTETTMTKAQKEYESMISNLSSFPISFVYDGVYYQGLRRDKFIEISRTKTEEDGIITTDIVLNKDKALNVLINAVYYKGYEAWDYTVYFENPSENLNSGVVEKLNAVDIDVAGDNAVLKGILGDYTNQYAPYDYDLKQRDVTFTGTRGRATHDVFPYFNLENDEGGALFALGWGGTWNANFTFDQETKVTNFKGTGVNNLATYLKPGEKIRTPLVACVRYYERDEDVAMNGWRKWMVDCNLPRNSADSDEPVQPIRSVGFANDTGRPNSDGSISEGHDTWKRSLDAYLDGGLMADYRWVDAGWYFSPYKKTVPSDWWGTVGTWDLDTVKWPNNSFRESVDYAAEKGIKTFLWFEPERVTRLDGMVANYGYKREWVLSDHGNNNTFVNNLGNKECLQWTLGRILKVMEEQGIHLYREDFNLDPAIFWTIGDGYEGENRNGITENLYVQGHYALWDGIIEYCAENGKATFVDSCASGGGRNDLESMRRGVPFLRSDSDRTTIELRLAMTTRLVRWLPFTGASSSESGSQLAAGGYDMYTLRASMLPLFHFGTTFATDPDYVNWEALRQGQQEWLEFKKYFYKDFYVLTPYRSTTETKEWTAFEYFDAEDNSGVLQAFRGVNCDQSVYTIKVKGVDPDSYYKLTDLDGVNSLAKIKGSALIKGLPVRAANPRSAITIYIEEV